MPKWHPSEKDKKHTESSHNETSLSVCGGDGRAGAELGEHDGQAQLAQILENCELWSFEPDTAKVFVNAIERLFYSDGFRIGKAVLPQANVRSRLWDLDSLILQSVQGKLKSNRRDVKNSTAYTMAVIFNTICESRSDLLVDPYLNGLDASHPPVGRQGAGP